MQRLPLLRFLCTAAAIGGVLPLSVVHSPAKVPEIPPPVRASDTAEAAHIRDLIRQLAKMDHADFGVTNYTQDEEGMAFAPYAAPDSQMPFRRLDTRCERFPAFVELVRLGPRALPYLLQAMDDTTPTRLSIYHGDYDILSSATPLGNRANARERKILVRQSEMRSRALEAVDKHRRPLFQMQMMRQNLNFVTVGDICITAIGQITGRDYQHLRFAGDGNDSVIVKDYDAITPATLRAIWSDCGTPESASRYLLDSLLLDYRSRAVKSDRFGDPEAPAFSDKWQISAAQRLAYYYPEQAAPRIVARLNALHVGSTWPNESSLAARQQRDTNQVDAVEFIEAVAESPNPAIRAAIRQAFLRSDDVPVWLACLPALDPARDWPIVENRLGRLGRKSVKLSGFITLEGLLIDLRNFGGERARPLFRAFQKKARSIDDCDTLIRALMVSDGTWDREFLVPFLTDKRMTTWPQPITSKQTMTAKPMRLCDLAANVLCWHRGQTVFPPPGAEKNLDAFERHLNATPAGHN